MFELVGIILHSDLHSLTYSFQNFISAGIVPRDFDNEYDKNVLVLVRKWIQNAHHCQGFIKLSIMNTLWVDSIEVMEVLTSIKEQVSSLSIKRNLLERKFCVQDLKPFELLMGLARNAGMA